LANFGDQLEVRLDLPFEAFECVLKFPGQPVGKIFSAGRAA